MRQQIDIERGGMHTVWVRAYTSKNSRRALQVQVGDALLSKTHTGSERHWGWEKAGEANLSPGTTTVMVHDADDGFESVDAIMVTDKNDFEPTSVDVDEKRWLVYGGQMPDEANALRFTIDACCQALAKRRDPANSFCDRLAVSRANVIRASTSLSSFGNSPSW